MTAAAVTGSRRVDTCLDRVGVVGCGLMGAGIAQVCAGAGVRVRIAVARPAAVDAGRRRVTAALDGALRRGKLTPAGHAAALRGLEYTADLADLADRQLVIESVVEDEPTKVAIFTELAAVLDDPAAILASNTSSIPVRRLAAVTGRPDRVVGTHFFNPVPVMPLVELVTLPETRADVVDAVTAFVTGRLGKQMVRTQDRPGFVVNALLLPYLLSAIRLAESGSAAPEDIDRGMVLGCGHPMGPLRLADLVGLDTLASMAHRLHATLADPALRPPPLLARMVAAGHLGRKSGRGFYSYD